MVGIGNKKDFFMLSLYEYITTKNINMNKIRYEVTVCQTDATESEFNRCGLPELLQALITPDGEKIEWGCDPPDDPVFIKFQEESEDFVYTKIDPDGTVHQLDMNGDEYWEEFDEEKKKNTEHLHLKIGNIDDPADIEEYTIPSNPYVIISSEPDCDEPDIRICRSVGDVIDNYEDMRKSYPATPIIIEEIINYDDYDEDVVNYVVACLKGLENDSTPMECEVEWENLSDDSYSIKFTTDLDYGCEIE